MITAVVVGIQQVEWQFEPASGTGWMSRGSAELVIHVSKPVSNCAHQAA